MKDSLRIFGKFHSVVTRHMEWWCVLSVCHTLNMDLKIAS
jgi:hypothetical protein